MTDDVEHFKNKYRATVSQGHKRYSVPKKIRYDQIQDWDMNFDVEYGVQIDMSQRDFDQLVHMEKHFYETMQRSGPYIGDHAKFIVKEHEREQRIRTENPAVRAAYEKYQTLLRMVDSYYD
jgi:hypothetical protein